MKKLVLFSCFNPDIGGGGVNLRTQIDGLTGWDITWTYLGYGPCRYEGCRTVCLGEPFVGGPLILDLIRGPFLWSGLWQEPVNQLARKLANFAPDAFWVLGMHEGILLVPELHRITGVPIHVSVQDDQEKGVFARMFRFAWMASLARRPVERALLNASSVDVTSQGMQRYYQKKFGLDSKVAHLAMSPISIGTRSPVDARDQEIYVGHIGTLYDESVGLCFAEGLRALSRRTGKRVRWVLIGLAPKFKRIRAMFADIIDDHATMPESDAVNLLSKCSFVYAMYPFRKNAAVFRQTSFPTKMSTYLRAGRPIFAHTPNDSTMAEFVERFSLGQVCQSLDAGEIAADSEALIRKEIGFKQFAVAAEEVFGVRNIQIIQSCLDSLLSAA